MCTSKAVVCNFWFSYCYCEFCNYWSKNGLPQQSDDGSVVSTDRSSLQVHLIWIKIVHKTNRNERKHSISVYRLFKLGLFEIF